MNIVGGKNKEKMEMKIFTKRQSWHSSVKNPEQRAWEGCGQFYSWKICNMDVRKKVIYKEMKSKLHIRET